MHQDIKEILFTEAQIKQRVQELGRAITRDLSLIHISEPTRPST